MNRSGKIKRLLCVLSGIAVFSSCTSDSEEIIGDTGKGYISLSIQADAGFQMTRAVSEDDYEDVDNYTVQILQEGDVVKDCEWEYSQIPDEIELPNGNYTLKAFYGEDEPVSSDEPYVEGTEDFEVKANVQKVSVTCKPTSAKVAVTFDEKMDDYFSDYSVSIKTKALTKGQTWEKADSEDTYYLKVEKNETVEMTINLTNQETKEEFPSTKKYTLSPGDYKNYIIAPKASEDEEGNGSLSVTITFKDTMTDHEIDIEIPADWK